MLQGVAVQLNESLAKDFSEEAEHIVQTEILHLMQSGPNLLSQL